jgi:hypothetical protein
MDIFLKVTWFKLELDEDPGYSVRKYLPSDALKGGG